MLAIVAQVLSLVPTGPLVKHVVRPVDVIMTDLSESKARARELQSRLSAVRKARLDKFQGAPLRLKSQNFLVGEIASLKAKAESKADEIKDLLGALMETRAAVEDINTELRQTRAAVTDIEMDFALEVRALEAEQMKTRNLEEAQALANETIDGLEGKIKEAEDDTAQARASTQALTDETARLSAALLEATEEAKRASGSEKALTAVKATLTKELQAACNGLEVSLEREKRLTDRVAACQVKLPAVLPCLFTFPSAS